MKDLIVKNRDVLSGIKFDAKLKDRFYKFKILYVNEDVIKISISFTYDELRFELDSNSFEGILNEVIVETSPNNRLSLARQASISKNRLKKVPIVVDGIEFKIDYVTTSQIMLGKLIDYDELLNCSECSFLSTVKNVIEDNLLENPPEPKTINSYGYGFAPFMFQPSDFTNFRELGHRRTVVSEVKLEKNREKFKEQREKEKHNMEQMEKLEKELNLNKKRNTRDLARHR